MEAIVCIPRTLMLKSSLFPRWWSHSYLVLVLFYCVEILFFFFWHIWYSIFLVLLRFLSALSLLVPFLQTGIQILEFSRAQSYPPLCSRHTLSPSRILIFRGMSEITLIQVLYHYYVNHSQIFICTSPLSTRPVYPNICSASYCLAGISNSIEFRPNLSYSHT